ncbi:hypothetical protein V5O48_014614, partial [Marasmius crinis-equi]
MPAFKTPLTNLKRAVDRWPSAIVFKIPITDSVDTIIGYSAVTYKEFFDDVETSARYWYSKLSGDGVPAGSVVGLCLRGYSYTDVLHIYGLMKAGYVLQTFTVFPSAVEALDPMLKASGARVLIYDEGHFGRATSWISTNTQLKLYRSVSAFPAQSSHIPLPVQSDNHSENDIIIIFHTSGSTSGPKHIPCTYKFIDAIVTKAELTCVPVGPNVNVNSWVGSVCHVGSFGIILSMVYYGGCVIVQTARSPSASELKAMITLGGLTRATMFPTVLSKVIQNCVSDGELLELVRTLDPIIFSGAPMPSEELQWALENGFNLVNLYGCTECGIPMLLSNRGEPKRLRPIQISKDDGTPLIHYRFDPVDEKDPGDGEQLKELVVLADSGDRPIESFLSDDGNFHTGDVFEEVAPGEYFHRGRKDDFIMMAYGEKCDAG